MLVSREELRFSFQAAQFDLDSSSDRRLLGWVFNQFLYGEVTGIQCGHWLYKAPSLSAAQFLAKQAGEELSHVRKILRILSLLGEKPGKAHWVIRFLSTEMMGGSWGEHVTLEMALGEGLVLGVFYAMADTIPDHAIQRILNQAILEEEKHVEFGERETLAFLQQDPGSHDFLLGLALVQLWALQKLKGFVLKRLFRELDPSHPILSQFEAFFDHSLHCFGLRIERLGLSKTSLNRLSLFQKWKLLSLLPFRIAKRKVTSKAPLLTSTYLDDPLLLAEAKSFPLSSTEPQ